MIEIAVFSLLFCAFGALLAWAFGLKNASFLKLQIAQLSAQLEAKNDYIAALKADFAAQTIELKSQNEKNLKILEEKLNQSFQSQSIAALNQNKITLNAAMSELLEPVKKSVAEYTKRLGENEVALKTNIDNAFKFSQSISQNAEKLAQILKGDKKIRGNFAETQLKSVLDSSGLKLGEQYRLQEHFKDGSSGYFLDAVVFFGDDRCVIIDSKFPLPDAFDLAPSAPNSDIIAAQIAKNLRARIDELASKPYQKYPNALDYLLLFIPYEHLLDLALSVDPNIYAYAQKKQIYLTTPNTLFMALNTINLAWRGAQADKNLQKSFEEIGKIYDKFAGAMDDFSKIQSSLNAITNHISNLSTKLEGRGGMISQFDKLKELGAKTSKTLVNKE